MNRIALFIVFIATVSVGRPITLNHSPGWRGVESSVSAPFTIAQPGVLLYREVHESGALAIITKTKTESDVDLGFADESSADFIRTEVSAGQAIIRQDATSFREFHGFCIVHTLGPKRDHSAVSYLLYARDGVYYISIIGQKGLDQASDVVRSYLSRISFEPSELPADIAHRRSTFVTKSDGGGRFDVGQIGGVIGAAFISILIALARRSAKPKGSKPPN